MSEKEKLEVGTIFEFEGKTWKVKSNNGFMLGADNMDQNDPTRSIQWIGRIEDYDHKVIKK